MSRGSAPGERRGGRQAGTPNRRTAALREAIEAEGVDPAVALVRIAKAAEEREEFALAAECYGKVLPFTYAKPKPAVLDPEETIAFERDLYQMKLEVTADAVKRDEGLANRLARAKARKLAEDVAEVFDALADAADDVADGAMSFAEEVAAARRPVEPQPRRLSPAPVIEATPAQPARPAGSATPAMAPAPVPEPAPQPTPILPRPEPRPFGDWSAPTPAWPERQAFADEGRTGSDFDINPYADDPRGFIFNR